MWEYKKINEKYTKVSEIEETLNNLGKEGWEIISYQEEKPKKFGDPYKCNVLLKRDSSKKIL